MAAEQQEEGPPLTELEALQLKSNQITDDSLESTRRMIQLCEDVSEHFLIPYYTCIAAVERWWVGMSG